MDSDRCPNNVKWSSHAPPTPRPAPEQPPRAQREERQGLGRRLACGRPGLEQASLDHPLPPDPGPRPRTGGGADQIEPLVLEVHLRAAAAAAAAAASTAAAGTRHAGHGLGGGGEGEAWGRRESA